MSDAPRGWQPSSLFEWLEAAVHAGAIAGGAFVYFQWTEAQESDRVRQSIAYVERFEKIDSAPGMAQRAVNGALRLHASQFNRLELIPDAAQRQIMHGRLIEQMMRRGGSTERTLAEEMDELVNFMESLQLCVSENLCSKAVTETYFANYAARLERTLAPFLAERRGQIDDYGRGLREIANLANAD